MQSAAPVSAPHGFTVLIPARLASTRLPGKPLADIHGLPMIVRVAQRAALSGARQVVVAADDARIVSACVHHGVRAILTRNDHPSGSDRLAEACDLLQLTDAEIIVNAQGDEPLLPPDLIDACAALLAARSDAGMATAAHPITQPADFANPNIVKLVMNARAEALYFSRAAIPYEIPSPKISPNPLFSKRGLIQGHDPRMESPLAKGGAPTARGFGLRHIGLYAYRAGFLRRFVRWPPAPLEQTEALEQLRALHHGEKILVHITQHPHSAGVDTPEDLERVRNELRAAATP